MSNWLNNQVPRITIGIILGKCNLNLHNLLRSICGQSYENFELILCSDGSSNFDELEIESVLEEISYSYLEVKGASVNEIRNTIFEKSKTELLIVANTNIVLDVFCVSSLVHSILKKSDIGMVSAISPSMNEPFHKNNSDLELEFVSTFCAIYRKSACMEVGLVRSTYGDIPDRSDIELSNRLYLGGYRIIASSAAIAAQPSYLSRLASSQLYNDKVEDSEIFLENLRILREQHQQIQFLNSELGRVRVLVFYDEEGWAWWHRANNLKRNLPEIDFTIMQMQQPFSENDYDFVLLFDAYLMQFTGPIPASKLIVSNSCPKLINDTKAVLDRGIAVASVINNFDTFKLVSEDRRYFCCQNGVDLDLFYPATQGPKEFTACWVGNSKSMGEKGLDIIQEACGLAKVPLLVFDASKLNKVSDAYTQEYLRDNLYHKASVFICASRFEGTPNPGLEALACGLPVISTRVGNMTELICDGYNGFLVERSVDDILSCLSVLKGADLNFLGINARTSVEMGWGWNQKAKLYGAMFNEIRRRIYFDSQDLESLARREGFVHGH